MWTGLSDNTELFWAVLSQRLGRSTALGCTGRTGARSRVPALGVRRVVPVAGIEPNAAGASRFDAQRFPPARRLADQSPAPHTCVCAATASPSRKSLRVSSASRRPPMRFGWPTAKQGARGGVRWPQPCLKHARPRLARPSQPPEGQGRGSRRQGGAFHSLHRSSRLDGRCPHAVLAWRRRARRHEWPESATRSRGGSSAARWHASRQGHPTAHPNTAGSTQWRSQGGEEVKRIEAALTSGRRCSRGRLGVDGGAA
jgi:hypothetical protein